MLPRVADAVGGMGLVALLWLGSNPVPLVVEGALSPDANIGSDDPVNRDAAVAAAATLYARENK
jgi:L-asparaginase/Glu-tRNA(Gln) amidotransferase subunit D